MSISRQRRQRRQEIPTISPRERFREATCGNPVSAVSAVSGRRELTPAALVLFEALKARPTKPRARGRR